MDRHSAMIASTRGRLLAIRMPAKSDAKVKIEPEVKASGSVIMIGTIIKISSMYLEE